MAIGQEVYEVEGHLGKINVAGYVKKVAQTTERRMFVERSGLAGRGVDHKTW